MDTPRSEDKAAPQKKEYNLADMLAQVTPENLHPEEDWGTPQGREKWWDGRE